MGIFDKLFSTVSVGSDKVIDKAGLSGFRDEVNLNVTQRNLAEVKKNLVTLKVELRKKQGSLSSLDTEIAQFTSKMNEYVEFCKGKDASDEQVQTVKTEARRIYDLIGERKTKREELSKDVADMTAMIDKVQGEVDKFDGLINKGADSISESIARRDVANSKIKLAESAERLMGNQTQLGSNIQRSVSDREAEASVKFDELFGGDKDAQASKTADDIVHGNKKDEDFEKMFK